MSVIYKKGREISDARIASNSLTIATEDLVSSVGWFIVKSTIAATTPTIIGVSKTEATFAADNETVANEKVTYVTNADDLRIKLATDADLTQAQVGSTYDIDANQDAVTSAGGTQLELVEIADTRVGIFKIV